MRWYRAAATAGLTGVIALAVAFTIGPLGVVTTNGISMQPRIIAGDLVVVAPPTSYGVGDSAAYYSPLLRTVVLHRIVAVEGDRYVFQGDNNPWLDPEKPTRDELIGKELLHIPRGGIWLKRLISPPALAAYTFLLLAGGAAAATTKRQRRRERRSMINNHATPGLMESLTPPLRSIAAGAAVLGLVGAALSALAWTRHTTIMTTVGVPAPATDATMDFSYTATVPPSAAYDGTTVTSPSPVFRTLTDSVDVTYRYTGEPGSLSVDAALSTPSGWTATVPLARQQPVGREHEGTVRLELTALEQRAAAAAEVIGVPAGALSIAVVPSVDRPGEEVFAPSLALTLDKHALKPTGELTAKQTGPSTVITTAPRETPAMLSALGRSVEVASARIAGLLALGLALLAALVVAVSARLGGPVSESERMQRRYGALLLTVLPVALTPGRPVIDVPDVAALVRLAERYGLLVLHWSRSGVDTYVVQDEATTFRYRSDRAADLEPGSPEMLEMTERLFDEDELASRSWDGWPSETRRDTSYAPPQA